MGSWPWSSSRPFFSAGPWGPPPVLLWTSAERRMVWNSKKVEQADVFGFSNGGTIAYLAAAPHPENFQLFFDKCVQRMRNFKDISTDTMRGIRSPALVMVGDEDVMRPEQAVEEYRLIPHSRLAVLPGTAHMALTSRTAWLVPMINEFLDAPLPPSR